jgi:hypothetical protein
LDLCVDDVSRSKVTTLYVGYLVEDLGAQDHNNTLWCLSLAHINSTASALIQASCLMITSMLSARDKKKHLHRNDRQIYPGAKVGGVTATVSCSRYVYSGPMQYKPLSSHHHHVTRTRRAWRRKRQGSTDSSHRICRFLHGYH